MLPPSPHLSSTRSARLPGYCANAHAYTHAPYSFPHQPYPHAYSCIPLPTAPPRMQGLPCSDGNLLRTQMRACTQYRRSSPKSAGTSRPPARLPRQAVATSAEGRGRALYRAPLRVSYSYPVSAATAPAPAPDLPRRTHGQGRREYTNSPPTGGSHQATEWLHTTGPRRPSRRSNSA